MGFSIWHLWKPATRRQASLEKTLLKLAGRRKFAQIMDSCPDRRELLERTAAALAMSEEKLLEKVARRLGCFCVRQVPAIDLNVTRGRLSLSDMRRNGCIAVINRGRICGLVCVNPDSAAEIISFFQKNQAQPKDFALYLARWETIIRALDESERTYLAEREKQAALSLASEVRTAERVLLHAVKEAQDFGQTQLEVIFRPQEIVYEIQTSSLNRTQGTIDNSLRRGLFTALSYAQQAGRLVLEMPGKELGLGCEVLMIEERKTARLTWSDGKQDSACLSLSGQSCRAEAPGIHWRRGELGNFQHTVLIIDDNSTFVRVLERFMQRNEIRTRSASDGSQALSLLAGREIRPDLVICDVHMPGVNGFDFVKAFRLESAYVDIPVVMLTSDDDIEVELKLINLGADAFIAKNEDPRILCAHVKRLLERRCERRAA